MIAKRKTAGVVFRETQKGGGRKGYIGVGQLDKIVPDDRDSSHSYALMKDYLDFEEVVPFNRSAKSYWESSLNQVKRSLVGPRLRGRAMREIAEQDFVDIIDAGLPESRDFHPSADKERKIIKSLVSRPFRDAAFRKSVIQAYGETCAFTKLRIINGGGRAEVQAAHIKSVKDGGPDITQNGLALSATCHWLFDRHLISLQDDYSLLVSHNRIPCEFQGLFAGQVRKIHLPDDRRLWPDKRYIAHHREAFMGHADA